MKKSIKLLIVVAIASFITLTPIAGVFTDREIILPGLSKIEYCNGYVAYEGGVAYSTTMSEAPAIIISKTMKQEHKEVYLHIMQRIGTKQFKSFPPSTKQVELVQQLINNLFMWNSLKLVVLLNLKNHVSDM